MSGRGHIGRGYGHGRGHGRGGRGGRGERGYGQNSYEFTIRNGTFMSEACVYPAYQWILLSLKQKNNIQRNENL